MTDPIIVEVTIAAPAHTVWRALREPEEIRRWHGWDYEGLAEEIRMIYLDATASDDDLTLDTGDGRFTLEPHGDTTTVRITRPAPAGQATWDGIYDEINEGWLAFTQQLRYYLERHPGEERRTIMVDRPVPLPDGEPWFRAPRQSGVLLGTRSLVTTPHGATVVSTYGLDDAAFERLRERLDA